MVIWVYLYTYKTSITSLIYNKINLELQQAQPIR